MRTDKIVVVGAGIMGTGIAHAFAIAGSRVVLIDSSADALQRSTAAIGAIIDGGVKLGKMDAASGRAALERIGVAADLNQGMGDARLLIETATENMEVKQTIVRRAADLLADEAVIATNTSALSISEIAAAARHPANVVGMHFFNPVHKMKLVEVIRGMETSQATVNRTLAWVSAIGKTGVLVNEAPGFTTSRISALLGNEAMYMLAEGVASAEDIDTSIRLAFNHPMGPLELGDMTGWDTRLKVLDYLHQMLGEKFRPCPLLVKMVKAGRHGRKVGRGVYDYDANGERVPGSGCRVSA